MATSSDDIFIALGGAALVAFFMLAGQKLEDNYCNWKTREQIKLGIREKNDEPIRNQGIGITIGFFLGLLSIVIIQDFF